MFSTHKVLRVLVTSRGITYIYMKLPTVKIAKSIVQRDEDTNVEISEKSCDVFGLRRIL